MSDLSQFMCSLQSTNSLGEKGQSMTWQLLATQVEGKFLRQLFDRRGLVSEVLPRSLTCAFGSFIMHRPSDDFYALLYLGLFCEVRGENTKAREYMRQAIQSEYANSIGRGDYMTSVARVRSSDMNALSNTD